MTTFPDARWGSDTSWLQGPMTRFAATRLGSLTIRTLTPLDRRLLVRTKGKVTALGPIGAPVLLLTTTGAKSGLERQSPLLYGRESDEALIVVGSNFGGDMHPAWSANLLQHPDATVTMGGRDIPVTATRLEGAEAERGYGLMVEAVSTYAAYQERTDRDIRVFRLTPRG